MKLQQKRFDISAKESRGSPVGRTLHFETPLLIGGPFERKAVEGWVKITLLNKLGKPMGKMELKTQKLIDELTELLLDLTNQERDTRDDVDDFVTEVNENPAVVAEIRADIQAVIAKIQPE